MRDRLVIVGGGMAATRLVDEVTAKAPGLYDITLIGEEAQPPYNRVLLSSLLSGEIEERDLELKPRTWWDERHIRLMSGSRVTALDIGGRRVHVQSGHAIPYDALVLATGSEPVQLPLPGVDLQGVLTFRNQDDVDAMLASASKTSRAVVIGGGLLGLEAAHGLSLAGVKVTVVHLMDRLMERQLDACAAATLRAKLEQRGIEVLLGAQSAAIEGEECVQSLRLSDGQVLPADMIVMAVGIRPNVSLARDAGLAVGRGIVVEDCLRTSAPSVYALGECAEHHGICYGLVEPVYEQASVLADHLAGRLAAYSGSLIATNLKVTGIDVFSAGTFLGGSDSEEIVYKDPPHEIYRKLVLRKGNLVGAVLYGDTSDSLWYLDLIRSQTPIGAFRDGLVLGKAFCGDAASATTDTQVEAV